MAIAALTMGAPITSLAQGTLGFAAGSTSTTVNEAAGTVTLVVNRTGSTAGAVSVSYTSAQPSILIGELPATKNVDYTDGDGTLDFADGESTKSIVITIVNDTEGEQREAFRVTLSNPTDGAVLSSDDRSSVRIEDDEPSPGRLSFAAAASSVTEGASHTINVVRTNGSAGTVTVDYTVSGGFPSGTLTFVDGDTSEDIVLQIPQNSLDEPDRTITAQLTTVSSNALKGAISLHDVTIQDDDIAPYTPQKAGFRGLLNPDFTITGFGSIQFTTTTAGKITGKLLVDGSVKPFSGKLSVAGGFTKTFTITSNGTKVTQTLNLLVGGNAFTGNFDNATGKNFPLEGEIDRTGTKTAPVPEAGYITTRLRHSTFSNGVRGFATVTIAPTGKVTAKGQLPDGTKFSSSSSLSLTGHIPLAVGLYKKTAGVQAGFVMGLIDVTVNGGTALGGGLTWNKPANAGLVFPAGVPLQTFEVLGAEYTKPAANTRAIAAFNAGNGAAKLELLEGNLAATITHTATIDTRNKVTVNDPAADKVAVSINTAKGTFTGSFTHPLDGKLRRFSGVAVQAPYNLLQGNFIGTDDAGTVQITVP